MSTQQPLEFRRYYQGVQLIRNGKSMTLTAEEVRQLIEFLNNIQIIPQAD